MATLVLGAAGAAIGSAVPGLGTAMGWAIGTTIGGYIDRSHRRGIDMGRVADLRIMDSRFGMAIPIVLGQGRLRGNIIWTSGVQESSSKSGGKGGSPSVANYSYSASLAIMACEGPVTQIQRIWADYDLIYDNRTGTPVYGNSMTSSTLRIYNGYSDGTDGNPAQNADTLVQASVSASNCPAYRNRAYVVLENYPLTRHGNRLPNITMEVVQSVNPTLSTVLSNLLTRVGLTTGDLSLAATNGITVRGLVIQDRAGLKHTLQNLQDAYQFDLVEVDGKISSVMRSVAPAYSPTSDDLGMREPSSETNRVEITRVQDLDLPRMVDVLYTSESFAYQQMIQRAMRLTGGSVDALTITLPIILTDDQARQTAEINLQEAWLKRIQFKARLPWRYLYLAPGDALNLPAVAGATRTMRIEKLVFGAPGVIEASGSAYDAAIYTQSVTGSASTDTNSVATIPNLNYVIADLPAMRDGDAQNAGLYYATCGDGIGTWRGATLFMDRGTGFKQISNITLDSTIGTVASPLGNFASGNVFDNTNTIGVQLYAGTLASATLAHVLSGSNAALVGNEIIQFTTATQIDATHWTLSGLLRGRKGTENYIVTHGTNEAFLLLDSTVNFLPLNDADVGRALTLEFVPSGKVLDSGGGSAITPAGTTLKPWSVVQVSGSRSGGDLTIRWVRRVRYGGEWLNGTDEPLNEVSESYSIDIMNGASVVRTLTASSPTVLYTAAQQTTDFGSAQSSVTVNIYQISARIGQGIASKVTI